MEDWEVDELAIKFFSKSLNGHSRIKSFNITNNIIFHIKKDNNQNLTILLINEYILGLATVLKALSDFPNIQYIVTSSKWNGYT